MMDESESKGEKPQKERRFDPELLKKGLRRDLDQYEFLKECSKKCEEGIKEWNQYRNDNLGVDIFLEGAYLDTCHLKGIHLESRGIKSLNEEETIDTSGKLHSIVYLKGAHFTFAELQEAKFMLAVLSDTEFGDIDANPDSFWGQTLLMMQVILGYVLLGALVTRFAVLFTAGGKIRG